MPEHDVAAEMRQWQDPMVGPFDGWITEVEAMQRRIAQLEAYNARMRPVYEAAVRWADSPVRFNAGIVSGRLLVDLGNAVKEARDE